MNRRSAISTIVVSERNLPALEHLLATAEHAFEPGRPVRASYGYGDLLHADSAWCLLAFAGEQPIGLCVTVLIPKLDARNGFLFIDEIFVTEVWRRRGVGRKLIEHAVRLAGERGLAGVRLLTRPANTTVQCFYAALGFASSETLFFERSFDRDAEQI